MNLEVCTLNFWGNEPPLEVRLKLAADELLRLGSEVIGLQEVRPQNGKDDLTTAQALAEVLGFFWHYEMSLSWADGAFFAGHPGGQEGLAVLSKYPILQTKSQVLPEARPTEIRQLLSAQIATPGGNVWFHTTHLHYRLNDGVAREKQVLAIDQAISAIPGDSVHILCGDFNAPPDSDEMRFLRGLHTLEGRRTHFQDAWLRVYPTLPGLTWCSENPLTRPLRSLDIDRRIDYIYVSTRRKDGRGTVHKAELAFTERTAEGICASDHFGVAATVQISAT